MATNPSAVAEEFVAKTIWAPNIALRRQQQSCHRFQTQLSQYTTLGPYLQMHPALNQEITQG
jgi:hypothetical protein